MTFRSLLLASVGGLGAYLVIRSVRAEQGEEQARVVYVSQPAPQTNSGGGGLASVLPFIDLGLALIDGDSGDPIFGGGSSQGGGAPTPAPVIPQTGGGGGSSGGGGVQSLLDMIARYEGGVNGYDVVYGGSVIQPPRPITSMTVQQVRNWQDDSVRARSASSAVGKYQIIRSTMDLLIARGVLRRGELFNREAQERAGRFLLERRGLDDYQAGRIDDREFGQRLSQEWASLPAVFSDRAGRPAQGQSYYAGDGLNSAHYGINDLLKAVRSI